MQEIEEGPMNGEEPEITSQPEASAPDSAKGPDLEDESERLDLNEAQTRANLVRFAALNIVAERTAKEEAPDDVFFAGLASEARRLRERRVVRLARERVDGIRKAILDGERSIEPSRSDYSEAESMVQRFIDSLKKEGPASRFIKRIIAERTSASELKKRSKRIKESNQ